MNGTTLDRPDPSGSPAHDSRSHDSPGPTSPRHEPLLLLASASAGRRATLRSAGIEHGTAPVDLDEEAILGETEIRMDHVTIGQHDRMAPWRKAPRPPPQTRHCHHVRTGAAVVARRSRSAS